MSSRTRRITNPKVYRVGFEVADMDGNRILVTGGAGFIGSRLVDALLADGCEVAVVDDFSTGKLANLGGARTAGAVVHHLDITSGDLVGVVAAHRPHVVVHLAAQMDVRASVADPVHDATVNVLGTVRLLEACRHLDLDKLVFATSGGCIYGEPSVTDLPVTEDHPGQPESPYGASKRGVEGYLHTYEALYGLRWTSLALGNVYGPRQDPWGEAGVVSIFAGRMLADEPVTIYGDGAQTRDFVFVDDAVDAFRAAMHAGDGLRINIGTSQQTSVNELHAELAAITGSAQPPVHAPERAGELRHIALDTRLAASALGWQATTALSDGLTATVDWLRTQPEPQGTP